MLQEDGKRQTIDGYLQIPPNITMLERMADLMDCRTYMALTS